MSDFEQEFLDAYLKFGLGSMPKSDIDALVMHLIDKYGYDGSPPLSQFKNQTISERLRTPVAKIKKLRYDAALKFGGRVEDQARARLLAALSDATLEADGNKIFLIIEDTLARNWLQGQLKNNQLIFEYTFNAEVIKVSAAGLFLVLNEFFDANEIRKFAAGYEESKKNKDAAAMKAAFKKIAMDFASSAAKKAGAGVVAIFKAHLTGTP